MSSSCSPCSAPRAAEPRAFVGRERSRKATGRAHPPPAARRGASALRCRRGRGRERRGRGGGGRRLGGGLGGGGARRPPRGGVVRDAPPLFGLAASPPGNAG